MNGLILARSASERYPRKHLHELGGVPIIAGIIRSLREARFHPILCTSWDKVDDDLCAVAEEERAFIYRGHPIDVWMRVHNCVHELDIHHFLLYSGDCPFVFPEVLRRLRIRAVELLEKPAVDFDTIGVRSTLNGLEGTIASVWSRRYWDSLADDFVEDDPRKEHPWVNKTPKHEYTVEPPWKHTQTMFKTSVDWPLEAALDDKIVRWLGRWPLSYDDITRAYRGITSLD